MSLPLSKKLCYYYYFCAVINIAMIIRPLRSFSFNNAISICHNQKKGVFGKRIRTSFIIRKKLHSTNNNNNEIDNDAEDNSNDNSFLIPEEYWKKKFQDTTWYYQISKETSASTANNNYNHDEKKEIKLPFKCTSCGNCCRTKGEVYISNEELTSIHTHFNITNTNQKEQESFRSKYILREVQNDGVILKSQINSSACIFLNEETSECKIYDARPFQCRTYPFWPRIMNSRDDWNNEVRSPGVGVDEDNNNDENNYWSAEKGGCEGMKYISQDVSSIDCDSDDHHDNDDGVEVSEAFSILEQMRRYEKLHLR